VADQDEHAPGYLAKLLGQATVILTGSTDAELKVTLFDTLQEFFGDSNCWQEWIQFTIVPQMQDYPIAPVTGRILRLMGVFDQNRVPQQAIMSDIGTVSFLYPYTTVQPMWACVVKNVTDPLEECFPTPPYQPDWVLPAYGVGIMSGLLGNMMLQPGQSYSNQTLATYHLRKFRDAISHARVEAMRANTVGAQAWAYPQQFRTFGQKGGVSTFNINPSPQTAR